MDTEKLTGKVIGIKELLSYQSGAIVSRTLVDKPVGTVTLFAFDKGQGLSEHTSPFDAMVYLLDGEVEVTISSRPLIVKEGEMVIMPAGEPHALKAIRQFKMLLVMIKT